jgi:HNH endonuclease/NUMOD4 motif
MIKINKDEKFVEITYPEGHLNKKYAISNHGKVISYKAEFEDGKLLNCAEQRGYMVFRIRPEIKGGVFNNISIYVHRFIAENFCHIISDKHIFCIHKDRNKSNNHYENLVWITKEEKDAYTLQSPLVQARITKSKSVGHKLTEKKVKEIKNKIWDPERKQKLSEIAKFYKVSAMCIHRIKTGQNWSHIQSDFEEIDSVKRVSISTKKKLK